MPSMSTLWTPRTVASATRKDARHARRMHARASHAASRPHARMASPIRPVRCAPPRVSARSGGSVASNTSATDSSLGPSPASSCVSLGLTSSSSSSLADETFSMPASLAAPRTSSSAARVVAGPHPSPGLTLLLAIGSDDKPSVPNSEPVSSPGCPTDPGCTLAARVNSNTSEDTTCCSTPSTCAATSLRHARPARFGSDTLRRISSQTSSAPPQSSAATNTSRSSRHSRTDDNASNTWVSVRRFARFL